MFVDSMALRYITGRKSALVRVTDPSPRVSVDTVSGSVAVEAIGVVGLNVQDRRSIWHYIEIPEAHYCPHAACELYPVQLAFALLRIRHFFDDVNEMLEFISPGCCKSRLRIRG